VGAFTGTLPAQLSAYISIFGLYVAIMMYTVALIVNMLACLAYLVGAPAPSTQHPVLAGQRHPCASIGCCRSLQPQLSSLCALGASPGDDTWCCGTLRWLPQALAPGRIPGKIMQCLAARRQLASGPPPRRARRRLLEQRGELLARRRWPPWRGSPTPGWTTWPTSQTPSTRARCTTTCSPSTGPSRWAAADGPRSGHCCLLRLLPLLLPLARLLLLPLAGPAAPSCLAHPRVRQPS
jgi:hypothetical protein